MAKKLATSASAKPSIDFSIFEGKGAKVVASISLDGSIDTQKEQQESAMRWRYKMRQRQRWSTNEDLTRKMEEDATEQLEELGITEEHLKFLAGSGQIQVEADDFVNSLIEVAIPWRNERKDWWARIMPWEFIISAATKKYRARRKRVVVRRLLVAEDKASGAKRTVAPKSFAILRAAPGKIGNIYDFGEEERLVGSSLKSLVKRELHKECGLDPQLCAIAAWCKKSTNRPSILHITGVDAKLGAEILEKPVPSKDGMFLSGKDQPYESIDGEKFAKEMFDGYQPNLVAFNLWNSGARMAPLAIAEGAQAAIGFEDTFDDSVAESFFAQFYRLYSENQWLVGKAFFEAIKVIGPLGQRTRGSSIILWTRDSLLVPITAAQRKSLLAKVEKVFANQDVHNVRDLLRVEALPITRLNYATLHNRGSIMHRLKIGLFPSSPLNPVSNASSSRSRTKVADRPVVNAIRDIEVQVDLCAGGETFPYRTSLDLVPEENVVDLANTALEETPNHGAGGIYIPLTSDLMRSVDESMLTSINVKVSWHQNIVYNRTFPIQLAPVDEWRFEEDQIIWMPSFVHPRDEAVVKIIDSAQRYLACLTDDCSAGFGGYQAYDAEAEDPWEGVDKQVQAIWTAISLDYGLGYINPPPSYSENSQRLRTPWRVLHERRGTCVDLALLMAACLEWVEIYPVIFNLNDHAFPGYWRSSDAFDKYQSAPKVIQSTQGADDSNSSQLSTQTFLPWNSPSSAYPEIRSYVLGDAVDEIPSLIPIETVSLTRRTGFWSAVSEARSYFENEISEDFYSMIDICRSRIQVTPIPLSAIRQSR